MIAPTFPELVAEADCIVRGTVTTVIARAVATPDGPAIHTFVTIAVEECVKGTAPRELTLTLAGGTLGDKSALIAGMPQFKVGDREILFVQGNGRLFCPLVGFYHGRYRVLTDATTGHDYVARHNRTPLTSAAEVGLPMLDPARLPTMARPVAAALTPADFLAQVRTHQIRGHAVAR
ncbi:MAG: hypothetical protein JNK23_17365 [Opitutaceae bacterium]|nr:hypothetical protein [Opitutaceae bacterium]